MGNRNPCAACLVCLGHAASIASAITVQPSATKICDYSLNRLTVRPTSQAENFTSECFIVSTWPTLAPGAFGISRRTPIGCPSESNIPPAAQTGVRQTSRLNGPIRGLHVLNFEEVPVPGNQDHPVMFCRCGDPDIVLGKRPPLLLQAALQTSVFPGNIEIA